MHPSSQQRGNSPTKLVETVARSQSWGHEEQKKEYVRSADDTRYHRGFGSIALVASSSNSYTVSRVVSSRGFQSHRDCCALGWNRPHPPLLFCRFSHIRGWTSPRGSCPVQISDFLYNRVPHGIRQAGQAVELRFPVQSEFHILDKGSPSRRGCDVERALKIRFFPTERALAAGAAPLQAHNNAVKYTTTRSLWRSWMLVFLSFSLLSALVLAMSAACPAPSSPVL